MPPGGFENQAGDLSGTKTIFRVATLVMRLEAAPRLGSEFDPLTNVETHTMEIPSTGAQDVTLAIGTVEIPVETDPSQNEKGENAFSTRSDFD